MKLKSYETYDNFTCVKFDNDIEVTLRPDGKPTIECDSATLEVIEMIKSGKLVIEV